MCRRVVVATVPQTHRECADEKIMLALSVRQPYAELILRGIKTIEYRSRATRIIGQRFHLYAAGKWPMRKGRATATAMSGKAWSLDLVVPGAAGGSEDVRDAALPWMAELANGLTLFPHALPTGVILGSAIIENVSQRDDGMWQWHLAGVERLQTPRRPTRPAQPTWFRPF